MRAFVLLVRLNLRELLRSRALVALAVVIVLLVATLNAALIGHFVISPAAEAGVAAAVATGIGVAAYVAAVVTPGTVGSVLFTTPLVRQQESGRIVGMVATQVTPRRLWLAAAAALWIVEVVAGLIATASVVGALWLVARSSLGTVEFDGLLLVVAFAAVPVMFAGLCLVMTQVGLTASAQGGNVIGIAVYAGLASGLPRMLGNGVSSEVFALVNLGIAVLAVAVAAVLAPRTSALAMAEAAS